MISFKPFSRPLIECRMRVIRKLVWNFMFRGAMSVRKFEKRMKNGEPFFPAFMMISVTNRCGLSCRGCWVSRTEPPREISNTQLENIIRTCRSKGSFYFGILGGEPLLYKGLFEVIAKFPDCYFQIFTNGQSLTREVAEKMAGLGNITPLISIEGLETESTRRRGSDDVFAKAVSALEACHAAGLFTGVAASICKSNYSDLVSKKYIDFVTSKGAHYLWYYIYRPAGPAPEPENALGEDEILALRRFIVEERCTAPLLIVDAYWDHLGRGMCPGAMGLSHHIAPDGSLEFCPPLQFAKEKLNAEGTNLDELLASSDFLAELRKLAAEKSRGCIILENPSLLRDFMLAQKAEDSSGRSSCYSELELMTVHPGHNMPGHEIPEKNPLYRFAKKHYFFGFGAYG